MNQIKITSDSTCDLPAEILQKYDIAISPLIVNMGEKSQPDHEGINEEIYAFAAKTKSTPQTAAISSYEYGEFFKKHLPENGALIHFNISSGVSSTHQNALAAAKEMQNVYVIDSRCLSTGMAVLILRAVKYRAQGLSAAEIVKKIQANINRVQCSFILKDLTYLHRGGRCSSTARLFATALRIKPQIVLTDGKMIAGKKFIGSFESCVKKYVDYTLNTYTNPDLSVCFITHTKMDNPQIVAAIKQQILAKYPFEQVIETIAGGTVTSHCGPNTIGVLYGLPENA